MDERRCPGCGRALLPHPKGWQCPTTDRIYDEDFLDRRIIRLHADALSERHERTDVDISVKCLNEACAAHDKVQRVTLPTVAPGVVAVPNKYVCTGCGQDMWMEVDL